MINSKKPNFLLLIFFLIIGSPFAKSEDDDLKFLSDIFRFGMNDAEMYLSDYVKTTYAPIGYGIGSGYFTTGETHKVLGFSVNSGVNFTGLVEDEEVLKFKPEKYTNIKLLDASGQAITTTTDLPTYLGRAEDKSFALKENAFVTDSVSGQKVQLAGFEGFKIENGIYSNEDGDDTQFIGVPVTFVQFNLGTFKNTDLSIRYIPSINGRNLYNLGFGIGIKHNIKQWIPLLRLSPYNIAVFAGATTTILTKDLESSSEGLEIIDGSLQMYSYSAIFQGIFSRDLSFLTPYVGIGVVSSDVEFSAKGIFKYSDESGNIATFEDPIARTFSGKTIPKINVGLRMRILVATLNVEYAFLKRSSINAGIGFTLR